jgi:hypothetical protein
MAVWQMRLVLGLFFLFAGATLLFLQLALPEVAARINPPLQVYVAALLGLVLGAWNLARWYASWMIYQERATPVRRPLQPEPDQKREEEYNPDFDFGDKK